MGNRATFEECVQYAAWQYGVDLSLCGEPPSWVIGAAKERARNEARHALEEAGDPAAEYRAGDVVQLMVEEWRAGR